MKCEVCHGTGKVGSGIFCACKDGKMKELLHKAEMKAAEKAEEEKFEKELAKIRKETEVKKDVLLAQSTKTDVPFKVNDWVQILNLQHKDGSYVKACVLKVDEINRRLFIQTVGLNGIKGRRDELGWVPFSGVAAAPLESTEEGQAFMLDEALRTKDETWFKELTTGNLRGW